MLRTFTLATIASLAALAAQAEEAGELTLTINGTEHAYTLWAGQSDWSGSENWPSINIYSRPAESDSGYGIFTLGFEVAGGTPQSGEARLQQTEGDEAIRLFGNADQEDGGLSVTVDEISASGDELSLSGSFTTRMGPSEDYGRTIDLDAGAEVSGTFDVTLGPVE